MPSWGFCHSRRVQNEIKEKWKDRQILGPCLRTEKVMEHEGHGNINCSWGIQNGPQQLRQATGGINGRIKTIIQTTALLRSARILRRVLETCDDLL